LDKRYSNEIKRICYLIT